jgi:hypothetical protein
MQGMPVGLPSKRQLHDWLLANMADYGENIFIFGLAIGLRRMMKRHYVDVWMKSQSYTDGNIHNTQ